MALTEVKECAISGQRKGSDREETNAVSGTKVRNMQNRHQNPLLPLNHRQKRMVEILREERASEAGVHLGSQLDNRAEITSKVSTRDHLVIFGILPYVNFTKKKRESGCKFENKCPFMQEVEDQISKKPKKDGDESAVAMLKDPRQLGLRISGHRAAGIFTDFTEEHKRSWGPIRRVRFTKAAQRHANIRENKGPPLGKVQIKNPHQRSPYAPKFEDLSVSGRD